MAFGFMGMFGRSSELRQLDAALRAVDLHPRLVKEGLKLAAVRLMRAELGTPTPGDYAHAAALIAYCMVGASGFLEANGEAALEETERRVEAATADGDSLDAQLVLLTLHAGVLQPSVISAFGLVTEEKRTD